MRKKILISGIILMAGLGVTLASAQQVFAQDVKGKLSTVAVAGDPIFNGLKQMTDTIRTQTGGSVNLSIFPSSQLGGETDVITGMKLGTIEAGSITTSVFSSVVPEVGVIDMPFIFRSEDHALKSYSILTAAFKPMLADKGYVLLGTTLSGVRHLASTFPITSIEDVHGKKMRVLQSPIHIEAWRLAGANPTPIPFPEVYNALQTGVVDFADLPKGFYVSVKWNEVAKHFTELGHIYALNFIVVSDRFWNKLDDTQKGIVQTAADTAVAEIHAGVVENDDKAMQVAIDAGSTLHVITDKAPWQARMAPLWGKFRTDYPAASPIMDAIEAVK